MESDQNHISARKILLLVATGILGFVLANFTGSFVILKMRLTHATAILEGILTLSGNIILAITISLSICATLRWNKDQRLSKKKIISGSLLIVVALTLAGLSFWTSTQFKDFDKIVDENQISNIKQKFIDKIDKTDNLEKKSKLSKFYAQIIYENEGKVIEYLTPEGRKAFYIPTDDAKQQRDIVLFTRTFRKISVPVHVSIGIIWLISVAAAVGTAFYRRRSEI